MRKIYLFVLIIMLAVFTVNAEKILIVGMTAGDADYDNYMQYHVQVIADEIATLDGMTTDIQDANVVTSGTFDFSTYDAIVITESAGSSTLATIGTYTDAVVKEKPVLNMKIYAIHDGKNGWNWCPKADFFGNADAWVTSEVATQAVMKIAFAHEIFGGFYNANDEIQLFGSTWAEGPHFQTCTFENSAVADIKSNNEVIGISSFIEKNNPTSPSAMMFAIEENPTCKRNVIWGVHSKFSSPTDEYKLILKNSVLWALKKEVIKVGIDAPTADFGIKTYPDPANNELNIEFTVKNSDIVNISLYDITGRMVYSNSEYYKSGSQFEKIRISNFKKGIYLFCISMNNQIQSQKIVIH